MGYHYLNSPKFADLADSTRRTRRQELDWLCGVAGKCHVEDLGVRHVEAIMAKKDGPSAANKVRKNLRTIINYGTKKELVDISVNPAWKADPRKEAEGGFHTWSEAEIEKFRERHPSGTKARLALELALNTGAARQDLARLGRQNIRPDGSLEFRRGKTGIVAVLRILPELAVELAALPSDQMVFLVSEHGTPFKVASLGNWFRDRANEAQVAGSIHGLRKAAATRLADCGATPDEIRSFLAHKTNKEGSTYTDKADRQKLAERAFSRVSDTGNVSNLSKRLGNRSQNVEG